MEGVARVEKVSRKNAILIPALNPPESLETYISDLIKEHFEYIILVDDGSDVEYRDLFYRITKLSLRENGTVVLLRHEENYGKGRALKTGFSYFVQHSRNMNGIITVDSDGQHKMGDVIKISDALDNAVNPTVFLGVRSFDYDFVPFKSKFGNKCTSVIFSALHGRYLRDTQTGLRGFTKNILNDNFINLAGERFEYEINMLIYAVREHYVIDEIDIETVYINDNRETHFHPLKDSWKVYKVLFSNFVKYTFSSFASSIVDLVSFQILIMLFVNLNVNSRLLIATIVARVISSGVNFIVNRRVVFQSEAHLSKQFIKYYCLCIIQMFLSAFLVIQVNKLWGISKLVEKIFIDTILFFISYHIQRAFIFVNGDDANAGT